MSALSVVKIREDRSSQIINSFLNKRTLSKATSTQYRKSITLFFGVDSIDDVTEPMIKAVDYDYIDNYFARLENDENLSSSTINTVRLNAPRGLYKFIIKTRQRGTDNEIMIKPDQNPFEYFEMAKTEVNSYDEFTEAEIYKLFEIANDKDSVLFKLAYVSAVRIEACLNANINDFKRVGDKYVWNGVDKGMKNVKKPFEVVIKAEQYRDLKRIADKETGKIFDMAHNSVLSRLNMKTTYKPTGAIKTNYNNSYCAKLGITEKRCTERNLTLHSIKKSSVSHLSRMNGITVNDVITHSHDSKQHALNVYTLANKNVNNSPSLRFDVYNDEKSDSKLQAKLEEKSKEELIAMIMSLDFATKSTIKNKL